jgi:uncharacterized membrane protein
MNFAHIHLALSHLPVVLVPVACILLGLGWAKNNVTLRLTAYWILAIGACFSIIVFLTGEPTEELLEQVVSITEYRVEAHEEAAELAFFSTLATGSMALLALFFRKKLSFEKNIGLIVLIASVLSTFLLFFTANLGGQIRHTEILSLPNSNPAINSDHTESEAE